MAGPDAAVVLVLNIALSRGMGTFPAVSYESSEPE